MKKFNKDKYLKKLRFNKYKRYLYIGISCLLILLIGIYFAYSKFIVFKEEEVVRTTVGDFASGDAVIGAYIDGEYSKSMPGKNDGYVVEKIVCDNNASASWNNDSWGIVLTNLTKRTKCNVYFNKIVSVSEKVTTAMNNNPSMFASDDPDNNVRYIGKNPDNYVYFNCSDYNNPTDDTCELWRIIGVFNNVTKSDGSKENLVKIIRADSLGDYSWDYKIKVVGSSTDFKASNDWTDSQLMMMLNPANYLKSGYKISGDVVLDTNNQEIYSKMGSYYNGAKGCKPAGIASDATFSCTEVDFTSTGLKNDATRNAIEEVVWHLGGNYGIDGLKSFDFYEGERGTTVYKDHATLWIGKIALIYLSDYGYATSGGTAKDRNACLEEVIHNWYNGGEFDDCSENDYLLTLHYQLTMTVHSNLDDDVFAVSSSGTSGGGSVIADGVVRPSLFLKSNISIKSGTGESSNPYQLKLGIA